MNMNTLKSVSTPALLLIIGFIVNLLMLFTAFYHIGNVVHGFYWLFAVSFPSMIVWVTMTHFYEKEMAQERDYAAKAFARGYNAGFEESSNRAYDMFASDLYGTFEEWMEELNGPDL